MGPVKRILKKPNEVVARAWFESASAPRSQHNANLPEIIIKGHVINLSRTRSNNFKKNKEVQNEYK